MANTSNLGYKVTTRDYNIHDLVSKAWGAEFFAPDHGSYEFSKGRKFDSTDKGRSGVYSTGSYLGLLLENPQYPDMPAYLLAEDATQLDQN